MVEKPILLENDKANEQIVKILLEQDELTWKNLIFELVKTEQMDPWDINISGLANKFLEMIRTLQEMDFRITGKLVLAAALLLKIKSNKLLEEDITALDSLISGAEDSIDLLEELPIVYEVEDDKKNKDKPQLIPRTPQPRRRKVSVDDLVTALEKALEVEMRRTVTIEEVEVHIPKEKMDISKIIVEVYDKIHKHHKKNEERMTFDQLLPEEASKEEKVYAFIPLLHLDHQRNVDLEQKEAFGQIFIEFLKEIEGDFEIPEGDLGS